MNQQINIPLSTRLRAWLDDAKELRQPPPSDKILGERILEWASSHLPPEQLALIANDTSTTREPGATDRGQLTVFVTDSVSAWITTAKTRSGCEPSNRKLGAAAVDWVSRRVTPAELAALVAPTVATDAQPTGAPANLPQQDVGHSPWKITDKSAVWLGILSLLTLVAFYSTTSSPPPDAVPTVATPARSLAPAVVATGDIPNQSQATEKLRTEVAILNETVAKAKAELTAMSEQSVLAAREQALRAWEDDRRRHGYR